MCGAQADNVYVCMYVHDWLFCGLHSPWTRVLVRPCRHALSCLNLYVCTSYVSAARIGLGHVRRFVSNSLPRWTTELLCSSAA